MVRKTSTALAAILLLGALSSALAYDSLNMRIVGRWPFTGCQLGVGDTTRNLCFAACGGGVYVLDITDPANPQKLSERIQTGGIVRDLYFDHALSRLYVACEEGGLELWDVRTATAPYRLGACPTPSRAWSVLVSGHYAFIANREQGISILDILDPANPHEVGRYDTPGDARDMVTVGQRLFVADLNTLQVLDWSNPQNPVPVGELGGLSATGIVTDGRYAYLSSGGMTVVDIRDPYHPTQVGHCATTSATDDIALVGNYVYVACHYFGLNFIDIRDPSAPINTGSMGLGSWGTNIKVIGSHGYAMGSELVFLDVSSAGSPQRLGSFSSWSLFGGLDVQGDYAFVTSWEGLTVLNVADPSYIYSVGEVDVPGWNTDVAVQGDYAYVGSQGSGTSVVDISDPTNPRVLATCNDGGVICEDIAVQDSIVVVAGQLLEVPIINVADPANPYLVGVFDSLRSAFGIALFDSLMLVADPISTTDGFRVINVVDPQSPRQIASLPTREFTWDVCVSGTTAYLAMGDSGVVAVGLANPNTPVVLNKTQVVGRSRYVSCYGDSVYVVASGLRVLDVTDPEHPREVAYHTRPYGRRGCSVSGSAVFLVDGGLGLVILKSIPDGVAEPDMYSAPRSVVRIGRNPVVDGKLSLTLVGLCLTGRPCIQLVDVAGRIARSHVLADNDGGAYEITVRDLASGTYMVRVTGCGDPAILRTVILNR